jgi:hypothetical protein
MAMFKLIEGMPPDVMAIEAIGEVTHEDYHDTLIPNLRGGDDCQGTDQDALYYRKRFYGLQT